MNASPNDSGGRELDPADPVIRAVAYQPPADQGPRKRRIGLLQTVVAGLAVVVTAVLWFLFTANSVTLEFTPADARATIKGGPSLAVGDVWLLRSGTFTLTATAAGHEPLQTTLEVSDATSQTHRFELAPLPGRVTFDSEPRGADIWIDGQIIGKTPLADIPIPAGELTVAFDLPRYEALTVNAAIEGKEQSQTVSGRLLPDWAEVTVSSTPSGAEILVDDEPTGLKTPATVEIPSGEHELQVRAEGYRAHRQRLVAVARQPITLPEIRLQRADGVLRVQTSPPGAGITLNGQYQGESPLEIAVQSGVNYRIQAFSAGYEAAVTNVRLAAGDNRALNLTLQRLTGTLVVIAEPALAELFVNGRSAGPANQTLKLPTGRQTIEVRAPGYAGYSTTVTPRDGVTQELKVRLLTLEDARMASLQPLITSRGGQSLVLLQPEKFTMGSSRRQPGRRANETLREVDMTRLFYLATKEVSNGQFRQYLRDHESGAFQEHTLNDADQPVVNVSWEQAALYCNWLSGQEKLPPFYRIDRGKVVGIDATATGYRLPTEAEWEWAARQVGDAGAAPTEEQRFPWGNTLPPPDRHGNYADRSVAHLVGRIIFGFNDNHITSAPVGTFKPSPIGIHDLSGNVAEWVNDFHEIPPSDPARDPLGPVTGQYHVIRGSSWMHGTITELRLSFRDYGSEGRQDVGFRIARFAETQ